MKPNAKQIETAKPKDKAYKLADGGGLYLEITPRGSKYWRMKYRRPTDKKEDRLAFGVYPVIFLADARAKRDEAKKLIANGMIPKQYRKRYKLRHQENLILKLLLGNGTPVISSGVIITGRVYSCFVIFISGWQKYSM
ncbi:Prophage CP4-57 integrase [Photorhabdus namnaonensis]|uniref:Prophage CP4-57 integrase n=1 Tax=Photorhabdus namnaonensis TaxID=1851568 RepID=A0A1B8YBW9_9GAMM|nr:Prophage CP4-57 integrase [Photorhabdus namnaonensis]